jgi:predicted metal-binding membrane protein
MVVTGVMNLAWMLILTLIVAADENLPAGRRLPRVTG